jgi:hypothetical protein
VNGVWKRNEDEAHDFREVLASWYSACSGINVFMSFAVEANLIRYTLSRIWSLRY